MMSAYAPWVYFHPDEEYFPSSASWFFQSGAELHKRGQVPEQVRGNGENLPNNVAPENAYLDLPYSEPYKDKAKHGYLPSATAYVHVKPILGGTFTDLAIWLYYPFNGGGRFQLGPFAIDLGIIGEHVGDWEHITLRVDNYRGVLKAVYLSQHAKGKWVRPREFELMNGTRPVVYSSLHSHSHYSTPTYYLHSASKLESSDILKLNDVYHRMNNSGKSVYVKGKKYFGFGARDDAAKSNNVMDIASHYDLVSVEYMDRGMEPWLMYTGRWGPKIFYSYAREIMNIVKKLPNEIQYIANKVLSKLPAELLGEEGPQGPKMRDSWTQDERV